jgi:hypothetical protein
MNNLAILPYICLHALQIQNVKRDVVKKVSIQEINKNEIILPIDKEELSDNNVNNNNTNVNNTNDNDDIKASTNIDDLPQPVSSSDNIGSEL